MPTSVPSAAPSATVLSPVSVSTGVVGGSLRIMTAVAMLLVSVPSLTVMLMRRVVVSGVGFVLLNRICSSAVS